LLSGLAAFFLWRRKVFFLLAVSVLGGISGILVMEFIYRRLGVSNIFKEVLKAGGAAPMMSDFALATVKNPAYMAALAAGGLAMIGLKNSLGETMRVKTALTLLAVGLVIPAFTELVGKYQIYYSWVAIIPATLGAVILLERQTVSHLAKNAGFLLLLAATLPGFPRRCLRIAAAWEENRPAAIRNYAQSNAKPTDIVFVHMSAFAVYYDLRNTVQKSYWNMPPNTPAERNLVSVAFLAETNGAAQLHQTFGGDWRTVDSHVFGAEKLQAFPSPPLQLTVYRRF